MCAVLCGPVPDRPTREQTHVRVYVDRAPATEFETMLLSLFDQLTPAQRACVLAPRAEE